jgi:MFS family permease
VDLSILKTHVGFRRLWVGDLLSQVGSQIALVAMLLMVYRLHSSTAEVAGLVFCQTVPAVFFGLYSGAVIDRFHKKPLLIGADIARALIAATIPFTSELWAIYVLAFLSSMASTIFVPAKQSVIPELVEPERRVDANSLASLTFATMLLVGPGVGGAIVGFWSVNAAFFLNAITFLWSAAFISRIPLTHEPTGERSSFRSLTKDVGVGIRYIMSHEIIAYIFVLLFIGNFALGFWFPVLPSFNHDFLHGNSVTFGLISSSFGLGSLLGAPIAPRLAKRFTKGSLFYTTIVIDALCFIAISFSPSIPFALALSVIWGFAVVVLVVVYETMMQSVVEASFRGRVFSMGSIQFNGGMLLAQLVAMSIAGIVRPESIFFYAGCLYLLVVLIATTRRKRFKALMRTA